MSSSPWYWSWLSDAVGGGTVNGGFPVPSWLAGPGSERLALTLVHSLWQGTLLALLLVAALRCCAAQRTTLRYSLSMIALFSLPACCLVTWSWLSQADAGRQFAWTPPSEIATSATSRTADDATANALPRADRASVASMNEPGPARVTLQSTINGVPYDPRATVQLLAPSDGSNGWAAWVSLAWMSGVAGMLLRLALQLRVGRQLRLAGAPVDDDLRRLIAAWARSLGIRRVIEVLVTVHLQTPAVMGLLRPVLFLPAGMLTGLTPDQLRLVLIHELAHIRRHDYVFNLLQMLVEAGLFFNPAMWWISRQTRIEREARADAAAAGTGMQTLEYVSVLAAFAERLARQAGISNHAVRAPFAASSDDAPQIAQTFAGGNQSRTESGLADRVRRVLSPDHSPELRVHWWSMVAIFALSFACLAAAERGTQAVISVAAKLLTPQERLDVLLQVRDRQTTDNVDNGASQSPPIVSRRTIRGTVRTENGEALPARLQLMALISTSNSQRSISLAPQSEFELTDENADTRLIVVASGFTPVAVGPIAPGNDELVDGLELVLKPGHPGRVKLEDDTGQPISDVAITGSWRVHTSGLQQISTRSDQAGIAVIHDVAPGPNYDIAFRCPGYEMLTLRNVEIDNTEPLVIRLTKARPATGIILTDDGQLAAGATLHLFGSQSLLGEQSDFQWSPKLLTTTDDQGRYTLDTLAADRQYTIEVQTQHQGRHLVETVQAGQRDRTVQLGPELVLAGTVVGDLDSLILAHGDIPWSPEIRREDYIGKHGFQYTLTLEYGNTGHTRNSQLVPLTVTDGVGHFRIGNLLPGVVSLYAAGRSTRVRILEPITDFTFSLGKKPTRGRCVILTFASSNGEITPQGTVRLHTRSGLPQSDEGSSDAVHEYETLPIVDGRVEFDSFAPGRVSYDADRIVGAWFKHGQVDVPAGDSPLTHTVTLIPAGAVHGTVRNADGTPASTESRVRFGTLESAPDLIGKAWMPDDVGISGGGRYFLSPIPLGGSYYVWASNRWMVSAVGPVTVDTMQPAVEVDIVFPPEITAAGQVVDNTGSPLPNVEVRLGVSFFSHSYGMLPVTSDRDGKFSFGPINPDAGRYSIDIRPRAVWQPVWQRIDDLTQPVSVRLQRGMEMTGVVLDTDTNQPIRGAEVFAQPEPGHGIVCEAESATDLQGRFRFSNLPGQPMRFSVRYATWNDPGREISAVPGAEPLTFRIKSNNNLRPTGQ